MSNLSAGTIAVLSAAIAPRAQASKIFPLSDSTWISIIIPSTFSPGMIQSESMSIHPDSRIPLSTTLPNSIDSGDGGPGSYFLPATGLNSAPHMSDPCVGRSGHGVLISNLTPA